VDQVVADPGGQFPAADPVRSHQQHIPAGQVAGHVGADGLVHGLVGRGAADAAVLVVLIERGGIPGAQPQRGDAFPGGGEPDRSGNDVLRQHDDDLDAAFEQARKQGDLTPLVQTVRRWWFEADAWRDPDAQRAFLARMDTYRNEGPPPAEQRMTREEIRARFGV
jgi:hypothetical protein